MSDRDDPYRGFRFVIEVDGMILGGFSEVSGIQAEVETEDFREGGVNDRVHKIIKVAKYPNLVLKRGITDSDSLWRWIDATVAGLVMRKNVRVILLDEDMKEKWHWVFIDAFPVKWSGPDLKADGNTVALEALELCHRGIVRA